MNNILYLSTPGSKQIEVFSIGVDFSLEQIQVINTDGEVQPIHTTENFLYAGIRPNCRIITYKIKKNGLLNKIGESPIPGSPNYLSIDRENKFIFCASYKSNCLSVSSINEFGIPNKPIQVLYNIAGCHYCDIDYDNKILFVTSLKNDCIYLYRVQNNGLLIKNKQFILNVNKGYGPRHMVFNPNKKYVYSINELNSTIDVWRLINEDNKLIQSIQNIDVISKKYFNQFWAADIHIHPSGLYIYASDRIANVISIFQINSNNHHLKKIADYTTEHQPRSFSISKDGTFLIVAGEISNSITLYKIKKNAHHIIEHIKIGVGKRPIWVHLHKLL
ncbi:6-phosphogluconolactonase [Buchnera aphidicola (Formosaphis micheliae)]|uniref:beta-propeller fold lactonase family protein n=1 Tax=Buchnera aphidicola TaxID=9 RepID=UPI0031CC68B7